MDKSCKRRAEYLRCSLVMVYTERGQWQESFIWEKSACLVEISVTEHILRKSPNSQKSWGNWACTNSVYQTLFSLPTHAQEPGNEAMYTQGSLHYTSARVYSNLTWLCTNNPLSAVLQYASLVPRPSRVCCLQYEIIRSEQIISYRKRWTCKGLGTKLTIYCASSPLLCSCYVIQCTVLSVRVCNGNLHSYICIPKRDWLTYITTYNA